MKYSYTALYEKNAAFYNARPRLKAALLYANVALTFIFFIAYGLFVAVAIWPPVPFIVFGLPVSVFWCWKRSTPRPFAVRFLSVRRFMKVLPLWKV